jgi:hypothetical protein
MFDIGQLYKNLSAYSNFVLNWAKITGTLHEALCAEVTNKKSHVGNPQPAIQPCGEII